MTNTTSEQTRTTAPRLDPRGYGVLGRLGLAVARHRRATLVVWGLVVAVAGGVAIAGATAMLEGDSPRRSGARTAARRHGEPGRTHGRAPVDGRHPFHGHDVLANGEVAGVVPNVRLN